MYALSYTSCCLARGEADANTARILEREWGVPPLTNTMFLLSYVVVGCVSDLGGSNEAV